MSLEHRIESLEKRTGAGIPETRWLVVVTGEFEWDRDIMTLAEARKAHKEAAQAKIEAAKAEFRAKHPEYTGEFNILTVVSEEGKELTERIIAGELPGRGGKHDARTKN